MILEQSYAYQYFGCCEESSLYIVISHPSSAVSSEELNVEK